MLTKCGHFLILKQENRKSFLLAICGFFLVIPLRFERKTHALEGFIYFYRY